MFKFDKVDTLVCFAVIVSILICGFMATSEPPQDLDFQTVTAYCNSYNPQTGWFTLVDQNGEEWVFEDNGQYAIDRPFTITYSGQDFELVSLSNNGQTVTF